jgi:hypothetical protein
MKFTNVRVPRENLLNRFADVQPDGQYVSSVKNPRTCPLPPPSQSHSGSMLGPLSS